MRNIDKYINSTEQTANGEVYKNCDAFANNPKSICYIGEYDLLDLREMGIGEDLTDTQLIEGGMAESRETICNAIIEELHERGIDATREQITENGLLEDVFNNLDWCCLCTYLEDASIEDFFGED